MVPKLDVLSDGGPWIPQRVADLTTEGLRHWKASNGSPQAGSLKQERRLLTSTGVRSVAEGNRFYGHAF